MNFIQIMFLESLNDEESELVLSDGMHPVSNHLPEPMMTRL